MLTILTALLLTNPLPPQYCGELLVELRTAVEKGWLEDKEAVGIYERCLLKTSYAP